LASSKRYTDRNIIDEAWFVDMSPENKCVWNFLEKKCDTAGIWKIDIVSLRRHVGKTVSIQDFLKEVNRDYDKLSGQEIQRERIKTIDNGRKLWITGFLLFQQGKDGCKEISVRKPVVKGAVENLIAHGLLEYAMENRFFTLNNGWQRLLMVSNGSQGLATHKVEVEYEVEDKESLKENSETDVINNESDAPEIKAEEDNNNGKHEPKKKLGHFKNVRLTDKEVHSLNLEFGERYTDGMIEWFSSYIQEKAYKSKSHNLSIRRWVIEAYDGFLETHHELDIRKGDSKNKGSPWEKTDVFEGYCKEPGCNGMKFLYLKKINKKVVERKVECEKCGCLVIQEVVV